MLGFSEALDALKLGYTVKRKVWDKEYLVLIEYGNQTKKERTAGVVKLKDDDFQLVYSYIALVTPDLFMPWSPTHVDLLEEDWIML